MLTIDKLLTPTGFEPAAADELAATLNEDFDGWTAKVRHEQSWSFVDVFDEDGEFCGTV